MPYAEMNIYPSGPMSGFYIKYEDYCLQQYGNFVFQRGISKNMDKLWSRFHSQQNYPEFYLGVAKKMAICKCPKTGLEEWYNADRCLSVPQPTIGSTITVNYKMKDVVYCHDLVFMGWVKTPVHEWTMHDGRTFQLEQKFVDELLPQDRRYLRMKA